MDIDKLKQMINDAFERERRQHENKREDKIG